MRHPLLTVFGALCLATAASGQFGNGCNANLTSSLMVSGSTFTLTVSGPPNQTYILAISDTPGSINFPGIGILSINIFSPLFYYFPVAPLDAFGNSSISLAIPNDPFWNAAVIYTQALVADPSCPTFYGITPALRLDWEPPDSFTSVGALAAPRALATADVIPDGRVFVAGGGSGSLTGPVGSSTTELYDRYTRTWSPGPNLGGQRAFHASARLNDGRVLLVGGADGLGNVVATCEIYDPVLNTVTPAASMGTARAGFTATTLNDGRVLVCGGTTTFTIPTGSTSIAPILNAATNTGELYDPVTDTWTAVAGTMASKRFIHTATKLANGKVLVVSGINGSTFLIVADVPTFTGTCNLFDPVTNTWQAAAALPGGLFSTTPARAGHAATLMNNGEVFIAGGLISGLLGPSATATTGKYNPTTNAWSNAGTMPAAGALQGQLLLANGKCHLSGGGTISISGTAITFNAIANCATRLAGGTSLTSTAAMPAARSGHLVARLADGTVLMTGGGDAAGTALATTELYTPAP